MFEKKKWPPPSAVDSKLKKDNTYEIIRVVLFYLTDWKLLDMTEDITELCDRKKEKKTVQDDGTKRTEQNKER